MTTDELKKEAEDDVIPLEITGSVKVYNQAYVDKQEKRIAELEQENVELKELIKSEHEINARTNNNLVLRLTTAKELLAKWVELYKPKLKDFPKSLIQVDTEQFLRETDIDNAIKQANEGMDFNKIADEMEQDLKDSEVEK